MNSSPWCKIFAWMHLIEWQKILPKNLWDARDAIPSMGCQAWQMCFQFHYSSFYTALTCWKVRVLFLLPQLTLNSWRGFYHFLWNCVLMLKCISSLSIFYSFYRVRSKIPLSQCQLPHPSEQVILGNACQRNTKIFLLNIKTSRFFM